MSKAIGVSLFALLVASSAQAQQIGDVFYIPMENHNWTQPSTVTGINQIFGNSAAPFINSLVTPGNPNAADVSYAGNYQNVAPDVHPSEPNYVWQEAGLHGPLNDADPYPSNIVNAPNLSALLQTKYGTAGWKSYQEDINLVPTSGTVNHPGANSLTSTVAPSNQWSVPTSSFSGTSASYTNPYNGSNQYGFAAKHDGTLFFTATNGGTATAPNTSPSNPETSYYAPLQQLSTDLANNTVAKYNWITPDVYNDMHTALNTNFTYDGVLTKLEQTRSRLRSGTISSRRSSPKSRLPRRSRTTARSSSGTTRPRATRARVLPPASPAWRSSSRRSPRATPTPTTLCIRTLPIW